MPVEVMSELAADDPVPEVGVVVAVEPVVDDMAELIECVLKLPKSIGPSTQDLSKRRTKLAAPRHTKERRRKMQQHRRG
jgi:hypothetical protein